MQTWVINMSVHACGRYNIALMNTTVQPKFNSCRLVAHGEGYVNYLNFSVPISNITETVWTNLDEIMWIFYKEQTGVVPDLHPNFWCAILIAHQLLWQNMEAPVSIFQESPLAGEPRDILFHIHSIHRYQLCAKYLYPSTLLWQMNGWNP